MDVKVALWATTHTQSKDDRRRHENKRHKGGTDCTKQTAKTTGWKPSQRQMKHKRHARQVRPTVY